MTSLLGCPDSGLNCRSHSSRLAPCAGMAHASEQARTHQVANSAGELREDTGATPLRRRAETRTSVSWESSGGWQRMAETGLPAGHSRPKALELEPDSMRLERPRLQGPARHELRSRTLRDWDGDDTGRCRILLLTSGLGHGHVRAAQAIEAALPDSATVRTLDLWSLMHAGVAQEIGRASCRERG